MISLIVFYVVALVAVLSVTKSLVLRPDKIPGPFLARVTKFYRVWLFRDGRGPIRYSKLVQKYGPVVRTGPNHVCVSNAEWIPIVYDFRHKFKKSKFYDVFRPLYNGVPLDTVFTHTNVQKYKSLKTPLITHLTGNPSIFAPEIRKSIDIILSKFHKHEGLAIDFQQWSCFWAFDLTYDLILGGYFGFMESEADFNGILAHTFTMFRGAAIIGHVPEYCSMSLANHKVMTFLRQFQSFPDPTPKVLAVVEERIKAHDSTPHHCGKSLLCKIMAGRDIRQQKELTEAVNVLFESYFATAIETAVSLNSIMYCLVTNPHVFRKLARRVRGERMHSTDENKASNHAYLTACIKEALRLHTSNCSTMERLAPPGFSAGGHHIPENTVVSFPQYVMHRDTKVYGEDAEDFRPERWLEADEVSAKLMEHNYMAFGKGSRGCIGREFAMMELRMAVSSIVENFDVALANKERPIDVKMYWVIEFIGLELVFRKAKSEQSRAI